MADQRIGYVRDFLKKSVNIDFVCKNEWIETPYDPSTAESINEPAESIYPLRQRRNVWLQSIWPVIIKKLFKIRIEKML